MKDKLISLFTRNLMLKIISLGVSFILWIVVVNYDDPIITRVYSAIPVELVNANYITDAGKVFEVQEDTQTVAVSVKAKRSIQNSLSREDFKATADLSKVDDEGNAPVEIRVFKSSDRIESVSLKGRNTVELLIEPLLQRQLNIQVKTEGDPGEDYMVGNMSLDKNVVKISGPKSQVDEVARAVVTVNIDGMTQDISTSEDIKLFSAQGDEIKSDDILMNRTTVGIGVQLWKIKTIPVTYGYLGDPADGFGLSGYVSCSPTEIKVAGVSSLVDGTASLVIPAAALDITGATEDKTFNVPAKDYLGSGLSLADDDFDGSIEIKIGISPLASKMIEVPVANVAVVNVPDGMNATVGGLGDMMALKVQGLGTAFDELNSMLVIGIIDVDALSIKGEDGSIAAGVYDAPVTFTYPDGVTDGGNSIVAQLILRTEGEPMPESTPEEAGAEGTAEGGATAAGTASEAAKVSHGTVSTPNLH